ncbi:MAG: hypothetical protein LBJ64_02485 [Deltaproteobacteria bacterium]|jgi:hypothetical protein|nr:hypothetical protein [Deltaproteobacteria bacterium]
MRGTAVLSIILVMLLAASGCAGAFSRNVGAYRSAIYSWLGRPASELEAAWGPPNKVEKWEKGAMYTWAFPLDPTKDNFDKKSGRRYDVCLAVIMTDSSGRISSFNPSPEIETEAIGCGFLENGPPSRPLKPN